MLTMSSSKAQLDDLMDARATVRSLKKELLQRKLAYKETKEKLERAEERMESVFDELEHKQGRLPFPELDQPAPEAPASTTRRSRNGNGKAKRVAAGQSNWKEGR